MIVRFLHVGGLRLMNARRPGTPCRISLYSVKHVLGVGLIWLPSIKTERSDGHPDQKDADP